MARSRNKQNIKEERKDRAPASTVETSRVEPIHGIHSAWRKIKPFVMPAFIAAILIFAFQSTHLDEKSAKVKKSFNGTLPKKLTVEMLHTDPELVQAVIAEKLSQGMRKRNRKVDFDGSTLSGTIKVDSCEL